MKPPWMELITIFSAVFVPAALIHLSFCFPVERRLIATYQYAQYLPYLISTIIFLIIVMHSDNIAEISPKWLLTIMAYRIIGIVTRSDVMMYFYDLLPD